jgi:hypothetical protein
MMANGESVGRYIIGSSFVDSKRSPVFEGERHVDAAIRTQASRSFLLETVDCYCVQ